MSYYDALVAKWATLAGTTQQKLDAVNALTLSGSPVNVTVPAIVGYLILSGAYLQVAAFAQSASNANPTHDTALAYAKTLMAALTSPNAPDFATGTPASFTIIKGMMDAILAQELAAPGTTGFTQAVHDGLLAMAATTVPWWRASVATGGGGLSGPVSLADLAPAGNLT